MSKRSVPSFHPGSHMSKNLTPSYAGVPTQARTGPGGRAGTGRRAFAAEPSVLLIVQYALCLVAFTIPLEGVDLSPLNVMGTVTRLAGLVFVASCILYPRAFARFPGALWGFAAYLIIFAGNLFVVDETFFNMSVSRLLTMVQLIVFFWLASNVTGSLEAARRVLLSFAAGGLFLAFSVLFFARIDPLDRATGSGVGPNHVAVVLAVSAVILLDFYLRKDLRILAVRLLVPFSLLLLLGALAATGSRQGVVIAFLAFAVYLLPIGWSRTKVGTVLLSSVGVGLLVFMLVSNPVAASRWQRTLEEGHTSGREVIFSECVRMIVERPILGWTLYEYKYYLAERLNYHAMMRDSHNLVLHIFLEVGMIGAIPLLIGIWLCTHAAWTGRFTYLGKLPLVLVLMMLTVNLAQNGLHRKALWFSLFIATAQLCHLRPSRRPERHATGPDLLSRSVGRLRTGVPFPVTRVLPPRGPETRSRKTPIRYKGSSR